MGLLQIHPGQQDLTKLDALALHDVPARAHLVEVASHLDELVKHVVDCSSVIAERSNLHQSTLWSPSSLTHLGIHLDELRCQLLDPLGQRPSML